MHLGSVGVELHLQETLPLVLCDSSQIQQVVMNLVMNAAEATASKGGGTVRVTTQRQPGADTIELIVVDDGEGIPQDHLSKIFDPFFTTKGEGKGVGLGLAVVYGVIHAHAGDIEVNSEVGKGTEFHVSIPIERAAGHAVGPDAIETGLLV
jgi:two-component system NtrC family sensor kinase